MREFNPGPNDRLVIGGQVYQVKPHPSVPAFAFGQEGRKAFVYQVSGSDGGLYALKKFKEAYRVPELANVCDALAHFARWPGLEVCARHCLHFGMHDDALEEYPDLEYAVLMPWITGSTWYDMVISATPLNRLDALTFANAVGQVLSALEESGLAHCDIAAPNVIINGTTKLAHLIDVEDLYSPDFMPPSALPAGTEGYAHKTATSGLWKPTADRFAGAILMAEMAAWHDPRIRKQAEEEHYFSAAEMQQDSPHYRLMVEVLEELHPSLAELFEQAWLSETLEACPPMKAWYEVVNEVYHRESLAKVVSDWQPIVPSPDMVDAAPRTAAPLAPTSPAQPAAQTSPPPRVQASISPAPAVTVMPTQPIAPPAASTPPPVIHAPTAGGPLVGWRPLTLPAQPTNGSASTQDAQTSPLTASTQAETAASWPIAGDEESSQPGKADPAPDSTGLGPESRDGLESEAAAYEEGARPAENHTTWLIRPVLDLSHVDNLNRPHLVWSETPGATSYLLQEADNPHFHSAKEFKVRPDDTRWHPVWGRSGRRFYRIRAHASGDFSAWSETLTIRIGESD